MAEIDLTKLSQQQIATLIGKRTSWMRDNSHVIPRNADGSYCGPAVVAWLLAHSRTLELPELTEVDAERSQILAELLAANIERDVVAVDKFLDDMISRYGDGGLAAVMVAFRGECQELNAIIGPPQPPETEGEIRERFARQLADALQWNGRTLFDKVTRCEGCDRIRRGKRWAEGSPAAGAIVEYGTCPDCKATPAVPRSDRTKRRK